MESTSAPSPVERFNAYFNEKCEKELLECSVCLESLKNPHVIAICQHIFCQACIAEFVNHASAAACPECRMPFHAEHLKYSFRDNTRLENLWNQCKGSFIKRSRKNCKKECKKKYGEEHKIYYKAHYKEHFKLDKINNPHSNPSESYPLVKINFHERPVQTGTSRKPKKRSDDVYMELFEPVEASAPKSKHDD